MSRQDREELIDAIKAAAAMIGAWLAILAIGVALVTAPTWGEVVDVQVEQWERSTADRHAEVYERLQK